MFEIWFSRWWRDLGFKDNLKFSRDRLVENYLWAMGIISEPHLSKCRIGLTKYVCIITAVDDMYDVYGLLDELECFTASVNRYRINMNIKDTIFLLSCLNHLDDKFYSFLSCPFLIFWADGKWRTFPSTWRFAMLPFLTFLMKWYLMSANIKTWIFCPTLRKR